MGSLDPGSHRAQVRSTVARVKSDCPLCRGATSGVER